jgi:hypothetical protein
MSLDKQINIQSNFDKLKTQPCFTADFEEIQGRCFCKTCRKIYLIRMTKEKKNDVQSLPIPTVCKRGNYFSKGSLPEFPIFLENHLKSDLHKKNAKLLLDIQAEDENAFFKGVGKKEEDEKMFSRFLILLFIILIFFYRLQRAERRYANKSDYYQTDKFYKEMQGKFLLAELVVVDWMQKRNHSDCEFHPQLQLIERLLRIFHPDFRYPLFDHYSPECYNEFREMICEEKRDSFLSRILRNLVLAILTDEMKDCSKQELIDYHAVLLDDNSDVISQFLHVRPVGEKGTKGVGLAGSFVEMTTGLFYYVFDILFRREDIERNHFVHWNRQCCEHVGCKREFDC